MMTEENIGASKAGVSDEAARQLDLSSRDPNSLNRHAQSTFVDVIGEPDGAFTDVPVYRTSYKGYNAGRYCCWQCCSYLCAVPSSFIWGICFAWATFCQIYQITPALRLFNMCFSCFARFYQTIVRCCCDPVNESASLLFTKIFVTNVGSSEAYNARNIDSYNLMSNREPDRM